ncbi:RNA 2',3'-cyclic phosphodiesterase [Couchioplanes caeruleus]|uniref:RNA 2',3'-cyclic phosphodiesterase n=1 Tax=Couchioplanes caeruleus TaxID=56438 RepID=UPI00201C3E2C|nr:RNA 2',3'-cyclic phosphodiesterase [Couchioplanes caeruleus]UQU64567.1 RNA 2',3'-cyclic phosphodiesterase [Couchioplanes caeruleus]
MRLFVAVYPPDGVRRDLRRRLDAAVSGRRVRLTNIEKWHVTLAFLGEVSPDRLPAAERALATVPVPRGRELRIRGGGGFGRRVTWAGVDGELGDVAAAVRAALTEAGLPFDDRPFTPHLTVLYAHDDAVRAALDDYEGPAWQLDRIELVRSDPGGTYTTLWAG